ncbi:aminotransferase class I/II-fold pyridoxal phosphate-dependent enzyme [Polycladidibacter hongkongensis]|uniref:aminotransferase class I/II-fold pyridoxal phosphate-dependent enzyme n=1 Tax=Polycladidibacter hongkongensis TaxID=1647556 RepID=UPI000AEDF180|nr:aminotransferase class I/II-fold pyridoxal phosphate-dependent enzyme [Pseudovibrio hongkongensis]
MTSNAPKNTSKQAIAASPFQRLRDLLQDIEPGKAPISLTIGEPKHSPPAFLGKVLADNLAGFGKYPPILGTPEFRATIGAWLQRRFALTAPFDADKQVIPLNGSREGLVFGCVSARDYLDKHENPAVILPNPYYQAYGAGAHMTGAEPVLLPEQSGGGLPDLDSLSTSLLDRTVAFYFATPSNPQGTVATLDYLKRLVTLARKHNFIVFSDECYSEIYRSSPPVGILQAAEALDGTHSHVVCFNSLSKRSNLPGLRCGFAAGDANFLPFYATFRNVAAPQVPLPAQAVAVAAFNDETHVEDNRRLYNEKYEIAQTLLGPRFGNITCAGGFFIWLDVRKWGSGEAITRKLWQEQGLRVLPGEYLAAPMPNQTNPATSFIRIALVENAETTRAACQRLLDCME